MLSKKNRISKEDFPTPKRQGIRVSSPLFSGIVYKSDTGVQVSVVVSKKTAKTAVVRNSIRRRTYSAISPYIKFLQPTQIVLYPKKEASLVLFSTLKNEIEAVLHKAKLL